MANLTREQVKKVVADSLSIIADLPTDIDETPLNILNDAQTQIFLSALKRKLNEHPYMKRDGSTSSTSYYDVDLVPESVDGWATAGDCIDWILANLQIVNK